MKKDEQTKSELIPFSESMPAHIKREGPARGSEDVSTEDVAIPRLSIIQSLSPQRDKKDPSYIEGAEEGMLFNPTTGLLYGDSAYFIPVYFRKDWLLWKTRKAGGGFLGAHSSPEHARDRLVEALAEEDGGSERDYEIVETPQQFGILVTQIGAEDIVISMPKSQMKKSRNFNTMVRMAGGDRWNMTYEVSTVKETNAKGSYYNWNLKAKGYTPEELWKRAEALYESIRTGQRTINMEDRAEPEDPADATDM